MIRYMLDTNMIAYAKNRKPKQVLDRLLQHDPSEIAVSAITMAELEFGVFHSSKPAQNRQALLAFMSEITVLPFENNAATEYGAVRQYLQSQGNLIGANDMLIAAHARSLGLILVTHNLREFARIPFLKLEDWVNQEDGSSGPDLLCANPDQIHLMEVGQGDGSSDPLAPGSNNRDELYRLIQDGLEGVQKGNTRPFSEAIADIRAGR